MDLSPASGGARDGASAVLPFRVHVAKSDTIEPTLARFSVRFARTCVAGLARNHTVYVQGAFAAPGYSLRVRYDGHTSRPLVLERSGLTELSLASLANEWEPVTPGTHELVVFARDGRGIVPLAHGSLAFQACRFEVEEDGAVRILDVAPRRPVLLSPEGTLHGPRDSLLMQVGGPRTGGWIGLRIERPDGGSEVHDLNVASGPGEAMRSTLFDLAPLQNGDYTFALSSGAADEAGGSSAFGIAQRLSVNREAAAGE